MTIRKKIIPETSFSWLKHQNKTTTRPLMKSIASIQSRVVLSSFPSTVIIVERRYVLWVSFSYASVLPARHRSTAANGAAFLAVFEPEHHGDEAHKR